MMLRVGLTGGIGSGKSTVARIFQVLGVPVYSADDAAKRLMQEDPLVQKEIIAQFGEASYTDGKLNRSFIASIVFNDKAKLELLNAITHPATIRDATEWMKRQTAPYGIKEAALLFESGSARDLDMIIGVYSPEILRIQRVMARDKVTREEVKMRMGRQIEESIKMKLCDMVIVNDEKVSLLEQVIGLNEKLKKSSKAL